MQTPTPVTVTVVRTRKVAHDPAFGTKLAFIAVTNLMCYEKNSHYRCGPAALCGGRYRDRTEKSAVAQGRTPRGARETPCGTYCQLREVHGLARAVAQLPVQPDDLPASARRSDAPDYEPRVQRRHVGRNGGHHASLHQGLRAALLCDDHQLHRFRFAGLYHRADARRLDGDLLDLAVLGVDLHVHLRNLLPHGRCYADDHTNPWYNPVQYTGSISQLY